MYVVDANIIFSALLSPAGRPSQILLTAPEGLIVAPGFLKIEFKKHYPKLLKFFTKGNTRTEEDFKDATAAIFKAVTFYSEDILPELTRKQAEVLVADIDPKDVSYIAFALFFNTKLWSGDKPLAEGLKAKGFDLTITTQDIAIAIMK